MITFLNSISAVALILVIASFGYLAGKLGWLGPETKKFIVKMLNNVAVPCLCVKNLLGDVSLDMFSQAGPLLLAALISISFTLALGLLLAKLLKIPHRRYGGFVAMCAFSNSIFVGYPMCIELFGEAAVPYIMMFYIVNTALFWTVGEILIRRSGETENKSFSLSGCMRGMLTPPLIALVICAALLAMDFKAPSFVLSLCTYMGGLVTPLALIYIGYLIYETGIKNIKLTRDMWAVMLVRFVAAPVSMLLLCRWFSIEGIARGVNVIEAGMPIMIQSVVLASAMGADDAYNAVGMSVTTAACFVVVPLLMLIV
ncbi:MAG: AEC family transporter [Clostridia bacterium]